MADGAKKLSGGVHTLEDVSMGLQQYRTKAALRSRERVESGWRRTGLWGTLEEGNTHQSTSFGYDDDDEVHNWNNE